MGALAAGGNGSGGTARIRNYTVPRTSRALQPCRFCATGKLNALLSVGLSSFCAGRTRAPNRIKASSKHSLCAHRIKGSSKHSLCASSHERASHPEGDHRLGHSTSGWLSRIGSSMVQIPAKTPEASRLRPASNIDPCCPSRQRDAHRRLCLVERCRCIQRPPPPSHQAIAALPPAATLLVQLRR